MFGSKSQESKKDGIAHLLKDHDSLRSLFARFKLSTNNVEKLHIVDQIVLEVTQHAAAEERCVYPLVTGRIDQALYERSMRDQRANKEVLHFLDTHIPTTPAEYETYFQTVDQLIGAELVHIQHEERDVITPLMALLSSEEKEKLDADILCAKKYGPTHLQLSTQALASKTDSCKQQLEQNKAESAGISAM